MTLATKNGSLIVKDGKIAENCGCCGGICDFTNPPESIEVQISTGSQNFYSYRVSGSPPNVRSATEYMVGTFSGTYSLAYATAISGERWFEYGDSTLFIRMRLCGSDVLPVTFNSFNKRFRWQLFVQHAGVRGIISFGESQQVRTEAQMSSANWSAGLSPYYTQTSGSYVIGSPTLRPFWFGFEQLEDKSLMIRTLNVYNSSQTLYIGGQGCFYDIDTKNMLDGCVVEYSASPFPVSGSYKGTTWYTEQRHDITFSIDSVKAIYSDRVVSLPL